MGLNVILIGIYILIGFICLCYEWKTNILKNYKDTLFGPYIKLASIVIYIFMIIFGWPIYVIIKMYNKWNDNKNKS